MLRYIAFFVSMLFCQFAVSQEKVAVIVSAGDLRMLEDAMGALEKQAAKVYSDLGFKVILVGGVATKGVDLSPEVLRETLSNLKNVKDLRLDFIGHGNLIPSRNKLIVDPIQMSEERRAIGFDNLNADKNKLVWVASNSSTADQMYYGDKAKTFGFAPSELKPITHNDVKSALAMFREKNSSGITTINLLNCFSGALAQDLRNTPDTIVFANSPSNQPALELSEFAYIGWSEVDGFIKPNDGLMFFYEVLGASTKKPISFLEARQRANQKMTNQLRDDPTSVYLVGRSPMFESALGWCESGKPGQQINKERINTDPYTWEHSNKKTLAVRLADEIKSIKSIFEYSSALPNRNEPSKREIDNLKESYESCLRPSEDDIQGTRDSLKQELKKYEEWQALRKLSASNPSVPMKLLMDHYLTTLNDPKKQVEIFNKVQASIENDLNNLKRMNLPRERWGAINAFIDGIKSGSITKDKIIGDLRKSVEELKTACVTQSVETFPCQEFWNKNQSFYGFINFAPMERDPNTGTLSDLGCAKNSKYFECVLKKYPGNYEFLLETYWSQKEEPRLVEPKKSCDNSPWISYQKTKANVAMDEACIKTFLTSAPDKEWENLDRILKLGERDIQGREPTISNTNKPSSGGAQ
ncbi:MAG: hypothetical protein AB7F59_12260 [Bdellovibrionales bacterium]